MGLTKTDGKQNRSGGGVTSFISRFMNEGIFGDSRTDAAEDLAAPIFEPLTGDTPVANPAVIFGDEANLAEYFKAEGYEGLRHKSKPNDSVNIGAAHRELVDLSRRLLSSGKSFGRKDSDEITEVKDSIRTLLRSLDREMPVKSAISKDEDPEVKYAVFQVAVKRISDEYAHVIEACNKYVAHIREKEGGKSEKGMERLWLVQSLVDRYEREMIAFGPTARQVYEESDGRHNWSDVLGMARLEHVKLGDEGISKVGAGASSILKRKDENGNFEFIKMHDKTADKTHMETSEAVATEFLRKTGGHLMFTDFISAMEDIYNKKVAPGHEKENGYPPFKDIIFDICKRMSDAGGIKDKFAEQEKYPASDFVFGELQGSNDLWYQYIAKDKELRAQWISLAKTLYAKNVEIGATKGFAMIQGGSTMADRNDSTSRLAAGFGLSDMIAGSKTVLVDQGNGIVTRANVMEGAKGQSFGSLLEEKEEAESKGATIDLSYTPFSLMQMFQLEVFDLICGQADRHQENYMVTTTRETLSTDPLKERWYIDRLMGIDNDVSLGLANYEDLGIAGIEMGGNVHSVPIFDRPEARKGGKDEARRFQGDDTSSWEKGTLAIHYISKKFYDRLQTYTPEMAMLDLVDQRSREELLALGGRIEAVRKIINTHVDSGEILVVDEQDREKMRQAYDRSKKFAADPVTRPSQKELGGKRKEAFNGVNWELVH